MMQKNPFVAQIKEWRNVVEPYAAVITESVSRRPQTSGTFKGAKCLHILPHTPLY